jgi:hypothetical protein
MSPVSWPVIGAALLLGAPAVWAAGVDGTLSPDVAALRVLLCLLVAWVALSLVASLSESAVAGRPAAGPDEEPASESATEVQQHGEQH